MDIWAFILAAACLGTFVLEVWGFWKIICLIKNIKEGIGITDDGAFNTGHMLKEAVVSIGLTLGDVDAKGKPTEDNLELQQALGNVFGFGAMVVKQRLMGGGAEGGAIMDPPKKIKNVGDIFQAFMANPELITMGKNFLGGVGKKATKKAIEEVTTGFT